MAEMHKRVQGWNNYYTNAGTVAPAPTVKDSPPYLDYPKEQKKQTNADKYFRNATDRQIADFIHEVGRDMACPPCICPEYKDCYKCWLDWLKQEVKSDG